MNKKQFINSNEFVDAVVKATQASFSGDTYHVEIFDDGSHRCLYGNQIGNLYESKGELFQIPQLTGEEYQEVDEDTSIEEVVEFYIEELKDDFN